MTKVFVKQNLALPGLLKNIVRLQKAALSILHRLLRSKFVLTKIYFLFGQKINFFIIFFNLYLIFNRPGVAGAVL